jgi:hypothetical protein
MSGIFEERRWLCRSWGLDYFNEMIRKDSTLTNIMNEWCVNGKEGNFMPSLKDFNPSEFVYFCSKRQFWISSSCMLSIQR